MSEFNATRQLKELKCELERKYYHLYDVDDPVNTIVQNAREVLHKQRVAIIDKDNKIKELREQLEKLQDYITKNYGNYSQWVDEDIADVAIKIMKVEEEKFEEKIECLKKELETVHKENKSLGRQIGELIKFRASVLLDERWVKIDETAKKGVVSKAEKELDKLYDYLKENYGDYSRAYYDDVGVAIETMKKQERDNNILKEKLEKLHDYIGDNYPNHCQHEEEDIVDVIISINDRLKTMVNHLKKDREELEYKLTKLSNSFICGMMSQPGIEDLERDVKKTEKKDNKLAKEVAEVKAYLDHKYPEFYEEHGQRRFSDVIKLLVLKLDG